MGLHQPFQDMYIAHGKSVTDNNADLQLDQFFYTLNLQLHLRQLVREKMP